MDLFYAFLVLLLRLFFFFVEPASFYKSEPAFSFSFSLSFYFSSDSRSDNPFSSDNSFLFFCW